MNIKFMHEMFVDLTRVEGSDLDVARAAWVSTKGQRAADEEDSARVAGLINMLMRDRHGSPFEQCGLQFLTKAPIFVWREHDRHRIGVSKNEQSGRYMQLAPEFYVPSEFRPMVQEGKPGAYTFIPGSSYQNSLVRQHLCIAAEAAYERYEHMLNAGIAKEVARMLLPVNIYSTAYVRVNLRSLMHFLSLRTKDPASTFPSFPQFEINVVATEYESHFEEHFPLVHKAFVDHGRVSP